MAGGNTQLLASASRTASADARMAPIPNPGGGSGVGMAPIPNPTAPSSVVASAQLPPLPTAVAHARPDTSVPAYARNDGGSEQQRTLASILPRQSAPSYAGSPRVAAADAGRPYGAVSPADTRGAPQTPQAQPQAQPRLRFVVGAQPAVILSNASSGGEAPAAAYFENQPSSPTVAPTFAAATVSDASPGRADSLSSGGGSADGGLYIQAGAFVDGGNAEHLRAQLARLGQTDIETASIGGRVFHRVVIGPMASASEADLTLAKVRQMGHPGARILSR
jgi:cell division protein FtsN